MPLPKTMSGMVLTGHGGLDKLVWRDDLAVPSAGPGEVVVQVLASSVNNTDINTRTAWYSQSVRGDTASAAGQGAAGGAAADATWTGQPLSFPRIQGADCCGEIESLIAREFALPDLRAAQEAFLAKRHVGKIAIRVGRAKSAGRTDLLGGDRGTV
jgi:NADPH:quinone reductase-like Zn-dependent oxidoreductase